MLETLITPAKLIRWKSYTDEQKGLDETFLMICTTFSNG
jgi:hypothetical protein